MKIVLIFLWLKVKELAITGVCYAALLGLSELARLVVIVYLAPFDLFFIEPNGFDKYVGFPLITLIILVGFGTLCWLIYAMFARNWQKAKKIARKK